LIVMSIGYLINYRQVNCSCKSTENKNDSTDCQYLARDNVDLLCLHWVKYNFSTAIHLFYSLDLLPSYRNRNHPY